MEIINTPPPLTFEQAMAILAEQKAETMAKIEEDKKLHQEEMRKRDEEMRKRDEKFEKELQARKAETMAKIEADKKLHEEEWRKRDDKFEKEMQEQKRKDDKFEEKMENLSRRFGDLGNRMGDIVECLLMPNLKEKFDKYGFNFRASSRQIEIFEGKRTVTDIDVLLHDGDCVMAIEVKTKPNVDTVERHIQRMDEICQHPFDFVINKKIYGAIACAVLDEDVKKVAFDAGFYVICQVGDNVNIVPPPEGFVAKYWVVSNLL
jgi:uncharacterized membrane protein YqiK